MPFVLIIGSLQHIRATQTGIVGMLEPVLATIVAWWWLGETLGLSQVVGGLIVLVGSRPRPDRPVSGARCALHPFLAGFRPLIEPWPTPVRPRLAG